MNEAPVKYRDLFAFLKTLGFEQSREDSPALHAFLHQTTNTLLVFGRSPDESVTPADWLSTEVHLRANRIVDDPLDSLITVAPTNVQS